MADDHPHAEWSSVMFDLLREAGVKLFTDVPDAGNERLIALAEAHNDTRTLMLVIKRLQDRYRCVKGFIR